MDPVFSYPQHGAVRENGLIRRLGLTLSWSQASYKSIFLTERGKMSKFSKGDILIDRDGIEYTVEGVLVNGRTTYYWVNNPAYGPITVTEDDTREWTVKVPFFEVGDTWTEQGASYEVTHVDLSGPCAWAKVSSGKQTRRVTFDNSIYLLYRGRIKKA